jgi:hypothetical protein
MAGKLINLDFFALDASKVTEDLIIVTSVSPSPEFDKPLPDNYEDYSLSDITVTEVTESCEEGHIHHEIRLTETFTTSARKDTVTASQREEQILKTVEYLHEIPDNAVMALKINPTVATKLDSPDSFSRHFVIDAPFHSTASLTIAAAVAKVAQGRQRFYVAPQDRNTSEDFGLGLN